MLAELIRQQGTLSSSSGTNMQEEGHLDKSSNIRMLLNRDRSQLEVECASQTEQKLGDTYQRQSAAKRFQSNPLLLQGVLRSIRLNRMMARPVQTFA